MRTGCNAPWSDIIVSSADNRTSICCMYLGEAPSTFATDRTVRPLRELWHAPELQAVRRLQAGGEPTTGCGACAHSIEAPASRRLLYFDFHTTDPLTERQQANMALAEREFAAGSLLPESLPLRYLLYFGWFCNLSCIICNQLPNRDQMPATLPDDLFEQWRDHFAAAIMIDCIGGEPFTIPPAIAFMRKFAAAPDLASVRLRITSNGTLLHKHLDWLKQKDRISFNISIDSIGDGYEHVRAGGKWAQVRDNLLEIRRIARTERPHWTVSTNALLTRSGVPFLPEFARFHVESGILAFFQALKPDRGNEEVLYREDILGFPRLLDDTPHWEDCFQQAITIFETSGQPDAARGLRDYFERIRRTRAEPRRNVDPFGRLLGAADGAAGILGLVVGSVGKERDAGIRTSPPDIADSLAGFTSADPDFGLGLRLSFKGGVPNGGIVGIRLSWPALLPLGTLYCHAIFYDFPPFLLLSWTEYRRGDERVVDMVICDTAAARADVSLVLTMMNARINTRNALPHRLEVWVSDD